MGTGNYCTINPLTKSSGGSTNTTISEGNTKWSRANDGSNNQQAYGTFGADSGKFYFEFKLLSASNGHDVGLFVEGETTGNEGAGNSGYDVEGYYLENYGTGSHAWKVTKTGQATGGASRQDTNDTAQVNDICKIAVDFDAGKIWLGSVTHNTYYSGSDGSDVAFATGSPTFTFTAGTRLFPYVFGHAQLNTCEFFFRSAGWTGTAPTDFKEWSTANLPAPTVTDPSAFYQAKTYTGNAGTNALTFDGNSDMQPDFLWIKGRNNAGEGVLVDSVRGITKVLTPDSTAAEFTDASAVTAFNSDGFTLGAGDSRNDSNDNTKTYVAWGLKAGGAASSNGSGSITSSVSAASHGGFSIGTFTTGTNGAITIGHGLSRAPGMIIVKDTAATGQYWTFHESIGKGKYLAWQASGAEAASTAVWNDTDPTTTVFSTQDNGAWLTASRLHVFYAFAKTPGLIAIGSYAGNNSTDGPMVVVDDGGSGFRPAWVMIKRTDSSGEWNISDSVRDTHNPVRLILQANSNAVEWDATTRDVDWLSNGFKIRSAHVDFNAASGGTYLYLAFAEHPFGGDGVAQARAR